jgi:hypothetical protein
MHFNLPCRITERRWALQAGFAGVLLVLIIGRPDVTPFAQTSESMRIRSMGDSFAGIVDDPHTDAYLNPARVGDLRNRQIYMARLPNESLIFYYPDNGGVASSVSYILPPETVPGISGYGWYRSFTPYTVGLITPVSGSAKLSVAVDVAADGYDDLTNSDELRVVTYTGADESYIDRYTYGNEHSLYHVVADAAIGTGGPESTSPRFGIRLRVEYNQTQHGRARVDQQLNTGYPASTEITYDYSYDRDRGEYEDTRAELSLGLFRNTGFVAQAVLGGGGERETLANNDFIRSIRDEDYDGNGRDFWGGLTPYYRVEDHEYDAFRSYDGFVLFGRLGLRWSDRVRSFHHVSWRESNGNGDVKTLQDRYYSEVQIEEQYSLVSYRLDGNNTRFSTDHSFGFINNIRDNLQIVLGVQVLIQYEEFEEDGDGKGSLSVTDGTTANGIETPYSQRATYKREYLLLNFPIGLEWSFHRHMAWRFGSQVRATRLDTSGEIKREFDQFEDPDFDENLLYLDINQRITYETSLYFSMGFEFTFWDRLSIDLLSAATTGSFNAANITTAQVKYHF